MRLSASTFTLPEGGCIEMRPDHFEIRCRHSPYKEMARNIDFLRTLSVSLQVFEPLAVAEVSERLAVRTFCLEVAQQR